MRGAGGSPLQPSASAAEHPQFKSVHHHDHHHQQRHNKCADKRTSRPKKGSTRRRHPRTSSLFVLLDQLDNLTAHGTSTRSIRRRLRHDPTPRTSTWA